MSLDPITAPTDPARVRQAIESAARRTGVDFGYLYNQARIESSLDPSAKARTSSASGLFQFTRQTWLQTLKSHGAEHGLGWAADAIQARDGRFNVADPATRAAIETLRFDPEASAAMAGEFASENRERLTTALGREPAAVDLYLAHFLGAGGATKFLKAFETDPAAAAAPLLPDAAAANRSIFYTPAGQAKSVGEIRDAFAVKLNADTQIPNSDYRQVTPVRWADTLVRNTTSQPRTSLAMASFEPMPQRLSLEFASRAYARLAGTAA